MKRFVRLLAVFLSLAAVCALRATPPLGAIVKIYPFSATRLAVDTARSRVYAVVPEADNVAVIDARTLDLIQTVAVGAHPVDLSISADNKTLYVANRESASEAIVALDLDTLAVQSRFALSGGGVAVAAGLNNRLYVSTEAISSPGRSFYQIDGITGAVQADFTKQIYEADFLRLSPDRKTLFIASADFDSSTLASLDVSTAKAGAFQFNEGGRGSDHQLVVSHTGKYVCQPTGAYSTTFLSAADINLRFGALDNGSSSGPLAFSPNDARAYQIALNAYIGGGTAVQTFDTQTFAKLNEVVLPKTSLTETSSVAYHMVADPTGSFLFLSVSDYGTFDTHGVLLVLTTGTGPLRPAALLPAITVARETYAAYDLPFDYQIVTDGPATSYTATNLPPGLSIDATTGLISGTRARPNFQNPYTSTITASNEVGTSVASLSIYYGSDGAVPCNYRYSYGTVGVPFNLQIKAYHSPTFYSAGGLPPGLSVGRTTGLIYGTPTASGTFPVKLNSTGPGGTGSEDVVFIIDPVPVPPPVVTSATAATALIGAPFTYQIAATNTPTGFTASGLPDGLAFDPVSGVISGVPTAQGKTDIALSAANDYGTGTATLTLKTVATLPTVTLAATVPTTTPGGEPGVFVLNRSGDTTDKLAVAYTVRGSAANGTDYVLLKGTKRFKAGQASAKLLILAQGDLGGASKKAVKVTLQTGDSYQLDGIITAKVKILAPGSQ